MSTKLDENYVKPSNHKQWQERSDMPVIHNRMTKGKIEEHLMNLVTSYGCDKGDISYDFEKITDRDDEDRDECLLLVYKMKVFRYGKWETVVIFQEKCLIPEHLKKQAERMKQEQMEKQKSNVKLLESAEDRNPSDQVEKVVDVTQTPSKQPRPKLRKPALPKK